MTTTDRTLADLARAWTGGDRSAGPPFHDALEEAGWPLEWVGEHLQCAGHALARLWPYKRGRHKGKVTVCLFGGGTTTHASTHFTEGGARAGALYALRRALRGRSTPPPLPRLQSLP